MSSSEPEGKLPRDKSSITGGVLRPEELKVVKLLSAGNSLTDLQGGKDLQNDVYMVLIAGLVGTGKSSLAAYLSGTLDRDAEGRWCSDEFAIGHTGRPGTETITSAVHHWFGNESNTRAQLVDLPGWGDPRGHRRDEQNLQALIKCLQEQKGMRAVLVVLYPKVRLESTSRRMLEVLEKVCSKKIWQNVIFVVNKWPRDAISEMKREKGEWISSRDFEQQMRAVLMKPKRSDSLEDEYEHFGLGLDEDVALNIPFFFLDTHYSHHDKAEETSALEQFEILKTTVDSMPPAHLRLHSAGTVGSSSQALAAAVRSLKVEKLEEALAVAQQSREVQPDAMAAATELLAHWQEELQELSVKVEEAFASGDVDQQQSAIKAVMASPIARRSRELQEEVALLQRQVEVGYHRVGEARDIAKVLAMCMKELYGDRPYSRKKDRDGLEMCEHEGLELQCDFLYPSKAGTDLMLDVREAACLRVGGVRHGDVVVNRSGRMSTVIGVGREGRFAVLYCHSDRKKGAGIEEPRHLKVVGNVQVPEGGSKDEPSPSSIFATKWLQPAFFYCIGRREADEIACFDIRPQVCEMLGKPGLLHGEVVTHPRIDRELTVVGVMYDPDRGSLQLWFRKNGEKGAGVLNIPAIQEVTLVGRKEKLKEVPANKRTSLKPFVTNHIKCSSSRQSGKQDSGGKSGQAGNGQQSVEDLSGQFIQEIDEAVAHPRSVNVEVLEGLLRVGLDANAKDDKGASLLLRVLRCRDSSLPYLQAAQVLLRHGAVLAEEELTAMKDIASVQGPGKDLQKGWQDLLNRCADPQPPAAFLQVTGCGIRSANGIYRRCSDLKNGAASWKSLRGDGYAFVWNVDGSMRWGLYEDSVTADHLRFWSDADSRELPVNQWWAVDGVTSAPRISAAPNHSAWRASLGDVVRIHSDVQEVSFFWECLSGHAVDVDHMEDIKAVCGKEGCVASVHKTGAVQVDFGNKLVRFSPVAMTQSSPRALSNPMWLAVSGSDVAGVNNVFSRENKLRSGRPCWIGDGCAIQWDVDGCGVWGLYKKHRSLEHQVAKNSQTSMNLPLTGWQAAGRSTEAPKLEMMDLDVTTGDMVYVFEKEDLQRKKGDLSFVLECKRNGVRVSCGDDRVTWCNPQQVRHVRGPGEGCLESHVVVTCSSCSAANGIYERRGKPKCGRPCWVRNREKSSDKSFAIAWNLTGNERWGLYCGSLAKENQMFFSDEASAGLPMRGWRRSQDSSPVSFQFQKWDMPRSLHKDNSDCEDSEEGFSVRKLLSWLQKRHHEQDQEVGTALPENSILPPELVEVHQETKLGEGGLGAVFKGRFTGETVSMKAVNSKHRGSRGELLKECKMLSHLRHPNIVQVFGVCEKENQLYIVMEFCSGGSLADYRRNHPNFSLESRERMAVEMCHALIYLHHQRIRHGDLKPGNILVIESCVLHCKLCDFNLAQFMPAAEPMKAKGMTVAYAAPEVLHGGASDFSADVYSLGICLFELISQKSVTDVLHSFPPGFWTFAEHKDDSISKLWPNEILEDVLKILRLCWCKEPVMRPTADHLCKLLTASSLSSTRIPADL